MPFLGPGCAGWRFNSEGACTKMPQTVLCRGVGVQSLPCVQKDGERRPMPCAAPGSPARCHVLRTRTRLLAMPAQFLLPLSQGGQRAGARTALPSLILPAAAALCHPPRAGLVWVWPGWETPGPVPSFAQPPEGFTTHAELEMEVPVEHGLLVENLLDLAHAPFTHTTTFARGWPVRAPGAGCMEGPLLAQQRGGGRGKGALILPGGD